MVLQICIDYNSFYQARWGVGMAPKYFHLPKGACLGMAVVTCDLGMVIPRSRAGSQILVI